MDFSINNNAEANRMTSIDGRFHEGMTVEDAKQKDISTQIVFTALDTSKDNKLSAEEIIARRKEEISMMEFSLSLLHEQYMRLIDEDKDANKAKILELDEKIVNLEEKIIQETALTEMYEEELANTHKEDEADVHLMNLNNLDENTPKNLPNCNFLG